MDQESFESSIKSKLEGSGTKPPRSVWSGISNSLNDQTIARLQSTQNTYKWVAVAAVVIAFFSFALNFDYSQEANTNQETSGRDYNALLPSGDGHFRLHEATSSEPFSPFVGQTTGILILRQESGTNPQTAIAENTEEIPLIFSADIHEIDKRKPEIDPANVKTKFHPYRVAQYRSVNKKTKTKTSFWAGVEAGAGNFNPAFDGSDPIGGDVDFDVLAGNLGQSGFVNPTSSALQNDMNEGIVTSVGLDFGMKVGRKWTIESGVQYTSVQNQSSASLNVVDVYTISRSSVFSGDGDLNSPLVSPGSGEATVEENFEHSIELDNNLRFTSIPVKAGYYIMDNRLSLRLNAGVSANYFLSSRLTDPTGQIENSVFDGYNEWSFDGLTGFELGYSIFENFNLTFEPNYRQSITPLSNSLNRSGFMVQTGFRYTIK